MVRRSTCTQGKCNAMRTRKCVRRGRRMSHEQWAIPHCKQRHNRGWDWLYWARLGRPGHEDDEPADRLGNIGRALARRPKILSPHHNPWTVMDSWIRSMIASLPQWGAGKWHQAVAYFRACGGIWSSENPGSRIDRQHES